MSTFSFLHTFNEKTLRPKPVNIFDHLHRCNFTKFDVAFALEYS